MLKEKYEMIKLENDVTDEGDKLDGKVEVEFMCRKCGRIHFEYYPESTDFNKLDTSFEHDFNCEELDDLDE